MPFFPMSSSPVVILVLIPVFSSSPLSVPSSLLLSLSYPKPIILLSSASSRTCLILIPRGVPFALLTPTLIPRRSRALGERSGRRVSFSVCCLPALSSRAATSQRRFALFLFMNPNSRALWCAYPTSVMRSRLTDVPCSVHAPVLASTAGWQMLVPTSCVGMALGLSSSGLTTSTSCAFFAVILPLSMTCAALYNGVYLRLSPAAAALGSMVHAYPTTLLKSLSRTSPSISVTYRVPLYAPRMTCSSHMHSRTSMRLQPSWGMSGTRRRMLRSHAPLRTLGSSGILTPGLSQSRTGSVRSMSQRLMTGCRGGHIPSSKHNASMASLCTPAQLSQWAALSSPAWRPSWTACLTVLMCRIPQAGNSPQTSAGGVKDSAMPLPAYAPFHAPSLSTIQEPSPMPARVSVLLSSSATSGVPGASSVTGTPMAATYSGLRPWASSSSSRPLPAMAVTSKSMATMLPSSRAGQSPPVAMRRSTASSVVSTHTSNQLHVPFLLDMSPASTIQPTPHRAAASLLPPSCSHLSLSPAHSSLSLRRSIQTQLTPPSLPVFRPASIQHTSFSAGGGGTTTLGTTSIRSLRHTGTTPSQIQRRQWGPRFAPYTGQPRPYASHLTPRLSALRPHCLARERLLLWLPLQSSLNASLSREERELIFNILARSLAPGTMETYGTGLLLFHVSCDVFNVPEHLRAPVARNTLAVFIADLVGRYSEAAVKNAVSAVHAWHTLHRHSWNIDDAEVDALIRAAAREAPPRRPARPAFDLRAVIAIVGHLNPAVSLDVAIIAAFLVCFWGTARLGELLPRTLRGPAGFSPERCVTSKDLRHTQDEHGNNISILHIPVTKVQPIAGEDIYWGPRSDSVDASAALARQAAVNCPSQDDHLFAYRDKHNKTKPLTKTVFLTRLKAAAAAAGVSLPPGHSICVSSTTYYLLHGLSFEATRVKGRWAGNSFILYLRRHAEIMAPYLQDRPSVHADVLSRTAVLPPAARH
ncbi:hypothetical protein EXIGLDRAFT_53573 [Exidia glandulosa HHB12029]|uniref:Uncharacterized protein n=1 Tax=Exidia glandulosa HHB12029 TaxID=1314781 RepID=A0A166MNZ7_EXIGL|nr:hypothetical protein EXIGLDRAFT_53573 [Exidia glandulosa HHB12029]